MEVWNSALLQLNEAVLRRCLVALCMAVAFKFLFLRPAEVKVLLIRTTEELRAPLIITNSDVGGLA